MRTLLVMMTVAAMSMWTGCKSDDDDDADDASEEGENMSEPDCDGTIPAFEDVSAFDKCVTCHDSSKTTAATRMAAPQDINFDTESAALEHAAKAAEEVEEGKMPPAGSGITISASQKADLIKWASCTE